MKKTLTFLLSTMLLTASLTACSSDDSTNANGTATSTSSNSNSSNSITMGGSTSVESIVEVMTEVYEDTFDISLTYAPTGSSTGVSGAIDGSLDIGLASRSLKDEEIASGAEAVTFALDGIAVVVNTANPIKDISMDDLAAICAGEITNWSEIGGDDLEIMLIGRDAASGTRDGFESIVGAVGTYAEEHSSTGAVIASVQTIPGALGYVSLSTVDEKVTALTVDGVEAAESTVKDGSYPIQRPFIFVLNSATTTPEVDAFVEWALGEEGATLVAAKGAVAP